MSSKFFRNFLPFSLLVGGFAYCVAQFRDVNYNMKHHTAPVYKESLILHGQEKDSYQALSARSLESEYQDMVKTLDLNSWKNIRGPRPHEESPEYDAQQLRVLEEKNRKLAELRAKRDAQKK